MSTLDDIRHAAKEAVKQKQEKSSNEQSAEQTENAEYYQAYSAPTGDSQLRLIIYAKQMFIMPRYDVLYDVVFNGLYEFIGLIYPHQRIKIYGRNLEGLVANLRTHRVEWLREYVPPYQTLSPDDDGSFAVITEIEIEGAQIDPFALKG